MTKTKPPITVSEAGRKGGKRSLETMTKEQRIIRAKNAVKAREDKRKPTLKAKEVRV